jgi:hypothetical protein
MGERVKGRKGERENGRIGELGNGRRVIYGDSPPGRGKGWVLKRVNW